MHLLQSKIFSPKIFKDIDEPVIYKDGAAFIQRSKYGSRISFYNPDNGSIRFISMKGLFCFNAHGDCNKLAFEFSGIRKGIGILDFDKLSVEEIDNVKPGTALNGIWNDALVLKYGNNIILHDIKGNDERLILSSQNMTGIPVSGGGICAYLQVCRGEYCINICSLVNKDKLIFVPHGTVANMYVQDGYLIYQCLREKKHAVFAYEIPTGCLTEVSDSEDWIELYPGIGDTIAWTVRKRIEGRYVFDLWAYNINKRVYYKVVYNCKNIIIPAPSENFVVWVESSGNGDSLYWANIS